MYLKAPACAIDIDVHLLQEFFGGVAAFSREQIMAVNGHSTAFWGWGKEGMPSLLGPIAGASLKGCE